ncbi:microtubule nucleation factor SSNA1 isoform X1 [Physcomitrium patens]|uniref:microtubule nucleation factor SSNA1 isoform X1 n=1 Tax=Physcomitrium patens TaxID=3218 RepID=UPI003CCDE0DE
MMNICGCWSCSEILTALSQVNLGIEELWRKKEEIKKAMQLEEDEKEYIQRELLVLTNHLIVIDESVSRKYAYVEENNKTIEEVEADYCKISKQLQAFLHLEVD